MIFSACSGPTQPIWALPFPKSWLCHWVPLYSRLSLIRPHLGQCSLGNSELAAFQKIATAKNTSSGHTLNLVLGSQYTGQYNIYRIASGHISEWVLCSEHLTSNPCQTYNGRYMHGGAYFSRTSECRNSKSLLASCYNNYIYRTTSKRCRFLLYETIYRCTFPQDSVFVGDHG